MGDLILKGTNLNLAGHLSLNPNGGKVLIGETKLEALVEAVPPGDSHHGKAPSVILPPPPAAPIDPNQEVWIVNSFNKTVTIGTPQKAIVALGMVLQGGKNGMPIWPGSLLTGQNSTVKANSIAINVEGDQAIIFPSGGMANLSSSGQA